MGLYYTLFNSFKKLTLYNNTTRTPIDQIVLIKSTSLIGHGLDNPCMWLCDISKLSVIKMINKVPYYFVIVLLLPRMCMENTCSTGFLYTIYKSVKIS